MRPIGNHIRAMLEVSDAIKAPRQASTLGKASGVHMSPSSMTRACKRAVEYGLMVEVETADHEFARFMCIEGWREKINARVSRRWQSAIEPIHKEAPRKIVNSVWSLGA